MSELTQMILIPEGDRQPLLMEVPVAEDLDGPFLITSSKSFLWIRRRSALGTVRIAVRRGPLAFLFRDALKLIAERALEEDWGSLHVSSKQGVVAAIAHLAEYDMTKPVIFYGAGFKKSFIPKGVPAHSSMWVPARWAVVLPSDRSFVGTTFDFEDDRVAMLIHNASRGVGIVAPESEFPVKEVVHSE